MRLEILFWPWLANFQRILVEMYECLQNKASVSSTDLLNCEDSVHRWWYEGLKETPNMIHIHKLLPNRLLKHYTIVDRLLFATSFPHGIIHVKLLLPKLTSYQKAFTATFASHIQTSMWNLPSTVKNLELLTACIIRTLQWRVFVCRRQISKWIVA